jgi:hypothetical protein
LSELNNRQRVTVNAALSMIALHGHNPRSVQAAAKQHIAKGMPANQAYSAALEAFASNVPAIRETLATVIALTTNSDEATLGQYDAAISHFNETGDNSKLDALGPMIVEDYKALLVRNGQATAEELADAEWDAAEALGFDQSAIAAEPWTPAPEELAAADAQPAVGASPLGSTTQAEGTNMTALTPKQYGEALRDLRSRVKGNVEDSPEYALLQARLTGNAPAAGLASGMPKGEIRNGEAYIPGYWTATGYRGAVTGERARQLAGAPITDTSAA